MSTTIHPQWSIRKGVESLKAGGLSDDLLAAVHDACFTRVDSTALAEAFAAPHDLPNFDASARNKLYQLACQVTSLWSKPSEQQRTEASDARPMQDEGRQKDQTATGADIERDPGMRELVRDTLEMLSASVDAREDRKRRFSRYSAFSPAWEIAEYLNAEFGAIDPGLTIGRHLAVLFDRTRLQDQSLGIYIDDPAATSAGRTLAFQLLREVGENDATPVAERKVCCFLADRVIASNAPDLFFGNYHFAIALLNSLRCPQALLTTLIQTVDPEDAIFADKDKSPLSEAANPLIGQVIEAFLLLSAPRIQAAEVSKIEGEYQAAIDHMLNSLSETELFKTDKEFSEAALGLLKSLYSAVVEAARSIRLVKETGEAPPFLPPQLFVRFISYGEIFGEFFQEERVIQPHITGGAWYRSTTLDGYAPFDLKDGYLLWNVANHLGDLDLPIARDLIYLLSQLEEASGDREAAEWESTRLPAYLGSPFTDSDEIRRARAAEYVRLFQLAKDDGLPDLAVALVSFFVFSQALRYQGRIGPWGTVAPSLDAALPIDRTGVLRHALIRALELANRHGNTLDVLRIEGMVGQNARSEAVQPQFPVDLPGFGLGTKSKVAEELEERFGSRRMARLGITAKNQMISAVLSFNNSHRSAIFGDISDWGPFALAFMKPIEEELRGRLSDAYSDPEYRSYLQQKGRLSQYASRPTLGHFWHLLKSYRGLPEPLKEKIDRTISLQHDRRNLERLKQLIDFHRNQGTHELYQLEQLWDLINKLYRENFLETFLDSLQEG